MCGLVGEGGQVLCPPALGGRSVWYSTLEGGMLCYSPSGLGEATWPCREAGSPRGLSGASYRLCSTSCAIWRHSALFPSADTVRSWAQHIREGRGRGVEIHRSPRAQARVLQVCAKGPADVQRVARGRNWQRCRRDCRGKEGRLRSDSAPALSLDWHHAHHRVSAPSAPRG